MVSEIYYYANIGKKIADNFKNSILKINNLKITFLIKQIAYCNLFIFNNKERKLKPIHTLRNSNFFKPCFVLIEIWKR